MKNRSCSLALIITIALICTISPLQAQSTSNKTLDTLIVTGTRISDRTAAESSSPIDIISQESLEATGTTELATALSRMVPSLNFPRPAVSDGNDAVRPAQLRGLSPDQVLVLVNGKRYHTTALVNLNEIQGRGSAPADLNTIPIAAIERIEVLRMVHQHSTVQMQLPVSLTSFSRGLVKGAALRVTMVNTKSRMGSNMSYPGTRD